jgi:hypothetical protein
MDNSKLTIIAVILCSAWAVLAMAEGPTDPLSSLSGVLMRIRRISRQLERGTRKRGMFWSIHNMHAVYDLYILVIYDIHQCHCTSFTRCR